MPFPIAAAIAAGSALVGEGLNLASTSSMNKKTRQFTEDMWNKQNAVNDANWHRQNAYNSPSNQRKLLEDAGLNPYLMYGESANFSSASAPPAAPSADWKPDAPRLDVGAAARAGISTYYDARMQKAQLDNLNGNTSNTAAATAADVALKTAQAASAAQSTSQASELFKYSLDAAKKANDLTDADIALRKNQGYMSVDQRQKIVEEIKAIKADQARERDKHPLNLELIRRNADFQKFKAELNEAGFTEHDSVIWRLMKKGYDSFKKPFADHQKKVETNVGTYMRTKSHTTSKGRKGLSPLR